MRESSGYQRSDALNQGPTLEAAENPNSLKGTAFGPFHNCFAENAALAAEGAGFSSTQTFSATSLVGAVKAQQRSQL
jgi:hypothetical protein